MSVSIETQELRKRELQHDGPRQIRGLVGSLVAIQE